MLIQVNLFPNIVAHDKHRNRSIWLLEALSTTIFPDHHEYTSRPAMAARTLKEMEIRVRGTTAVIVCSE